MAEPTASDNPTESQPDLNTAWREHIPEDLKQEKFWDNVPDMPTLVKNYGNAQKLIGSSVRVPGEDATPEQLASFHKRLGRPDDPKGYQLTDVPGADKMPQETVEWFKQIAFDEGISQKAFNGLLSKYMARVNQSQIEQEVTLRAGAQQAAETLKRADQWGANFDRNLAYAKRAMGKLGSDAVVEKIEASGLGNDIDFLNMFYLVGRQMAEHGIIPGEVSGIMNADAAKIRIGELRARPEYFDNKLPGHRELVDEMQRLYQLAHE